VPTLAELQSEMAAAILTHDGTGPGEIRGDGIAAAQRLDVYRSNTLGALTDALADAFPVVCQLVGERFFAAVAQSFIYVQPPATSCIAEYGAGFPDFLAGFEPARGLPYLPDTARLDWAVHRAFHAPDAAALDPSRIATMAPADYDGLRFVPHPACRIVTSGFPVDRIWRAHHGDGDFADIDLTQGAGCRVLIDRHDTAIRLLELGEGECALLEMLFAGHPLGEALSEALSREPGLELPPLLARHLQRATFSDVILPSTTDAHPQPASN
jgi:hypothetical protein